MTDPFAALGVVMVRRQRLVITVSVVFLVLAGSLWFRANDVVKTGGFDLPNSPSANVKQILGRDFAATAGYTAVVIYHSPTLTVSDSAYRDEVISSSQRVRSVQNVRFVLTFFNSGYPTLVSRDRHTTMALVTVTGSEGAQAKTIPELRQRLRSLSIEHYLTGYAPLEEDTLATSEEDLRRFELIAFPIILILLLLVFRTGVAATMPLLLAAWSVTLTTALIGLLGSLTDVSVFALNVASMIGLGLAIDFSLIMITRFRQEMAAGLEPPEAVVRTMSTAGRSITYSAVTVMLSMPIMALVMRRFIIVQSIALGVMFVALTSLVVALTLLPAVLGLLGSRIEWLRVVPRRKAAIASEIGVWYRISHAIMRRPWMWLIASLIALTALAFPIRDLKTGVKTTGDLPSTTESVVGANLMSRAFGPGQLTPIQIVLRTVKNGVWTPRFLSDIQRLTDVLAADARVQGVQSLSTIATTAGIPAGSFTQLSRQAVDARFALARAATQVVNLNGRDDVALVTVTSRYTEFAPEHQRLVRDLRSKIIPGVAQLRAYDVSVGGEAASSIDFSDTLYQQFPIVIGLILVMIFIILLLFFHSITLPLKAMFMNLATLISTYGALVVLFQYGAGDGVFGFTSQGMLEAITPVILFAILLALSTDYEVFMLSRVKEYYEQSHNNREAVAAGLQSVGGTITAAGLILIATFSAFATAHVLTLKELGLGLAIGVLLDSTIVRVIMVPSTMRLMGDWNWWMPGWLAKLVPELREAPALGPASPAIAQAAAVARPGRANQTIQLSGGQSALPLRVVGHLRPVGQSVGTDLITLPQTKPLRIGRSASNELRLFDERVSRFHSRIDFSRGHFFVTDVGSKNGTLLNGQRLPAYQRTPLRPGDVIQIGMLINVTFSFDLSPLEHTSVARPRGIADARSAPG